MSPPGRRQGRANPSSRRQGAAALELAIILPVSVTLMLGCIDFAQVIHAHIALCNAARVGADYGATHRFTEETQADWNARVRSIVLDEASTIPALSLSKLIVTIDVSEFTSEINDVSVTCQYEFRTAVNWPGLPSVIALRHQVTMRQYQ